SLQIRPVQLGDGVRVEPRLAGSGGQCLPFTPGQAVVEHGLFQYREVTVGALVRSVREAGDDLVEPPTLPAAYGVASLGSFDGVRRRRFGPGVGTGGFELVLPWWRAIAGEQKEPEQLRRRQCVSDGGVRAGQDDPGARAAVG